MSLTSIMKGKKKNNVRRGEGEEGALGPAGTYAGQYRGLSHKPLSGYCLVDCLGKEVLVI